MPTVPMDTMTAREIAGRMVWRETPACVKTVSRRVITIFLEISRGDLHFPLVYPRKLGLCTEMAAQKDDGNNEACLDIHGGSVHLPCSVVRIQRSVENNEVTKCKKLVCSI